MTEDPALRILHVASGDLWAGAEAQVAALLGRLIGFPGLAVQAVVLNPGELAKRLAAAGVPVTVLDERRSSAREILSGLRHVMRAFRPDIVHTHRTKENVLGSLAARLEGVRASLRTVHGAAEHAPPLWRLDKHAYRALDEFAARHWQQACVAVSTELGGQLRRSMPQRRIEVIHNGLDEEGYACLRARHLARRSAAEKRVAFLGRLVPVKRVDLLLEAAAVLVQQQRHAWHFDILGEGPLADVLQARAQGLGLGRFVTFHGFRADAVDLLAECDGLVFTSDHEGTPMAALEALAIGVPVMARAVGGLVELLEEAPGCALVASDSPVAIAGGIEAVVAADERRQVSLPERYRIRHCAEDYVKLYRALTQAT